MFTVDKKKKCIIWGTGNYCREKIKYWDENYGVIGGFVDRTNKVFMNKKTFTPDQLIEVDYDEICIFSFSYLEIAKELINMNIDNEKIKPGICFKPYMPNELEYICNGISFSFDNKARLEARLLGETVFVEKEADWARVKELTCCENNKNNIEKLDIKPVGRVFGLNRGESIARYYISQFIETNREFIKGNILEIGDLKYSSLYKNKNSQSYCLHFGDDFIVDDENFKGDLSTGDGINRDFYDCIILTQVLNCIEEISNVGNVICNSLKPGGVALITVSSISPVSRYDMDRWGYYWNFTKKGLCKLFDNLSVTIDVQTYGNSKIACAFIQGMSANELRKNELDYNDDDCSIIVSAVVKKNVI